MNKTQFDIQPIGKWYGPSAAIKRPKARELYLLDYCSVPEAQEIAYFSYDDKHQYRPDGSGVRYYYPPTIGADLSRGFDTFEKLDDTADDHLDALLKTLAAQERETGNKVEADVITWRGMMTKIMATPFSDRDGFEMNATLFQGTIFIEESHNYKLASQAKQSKQASAPGRPSQDMMSYWGYKFETLCLMPDIWDTTSRDYIEGRENEIVNNHAQYVSIVRTGIGKATMVIGGEVDAVWDIKPPLPHTRINWVELKTSVSPMSDRDMLSFERKLMKFWIQSFLLGVPRIIVGFRDQRGILLRTEEMETEKIPGTVKRVGKATWDGNMCINFAAAFLDYVKSTITTDGVWRIRRQERAPVIEIFKLEEAGHGDILSDEFVAWRREMAGRGNGEAVAA